MSTAVLAAGKEVNSNAQTGGSAGGGGGAAAAGGGAVAAAPPISRGPSFPTADGHVHSWKPQPAPTDSASGKGFPDASHSAAHTDHLNNFTAMEVHLKSRCHGFQLEGLSHDITPTGMHYLLIHYDIPKIDGEAYSLRIHGQVRSPLSIDMEQLRARPAVTRAVTMECGGAGRVHQKHRLWQHVPWGDDAIGTSLWTGCTLGDLLKEAGPLDGVKSVIFTGRDKGIEAGEVQRFQRSLTLEHAMRPEVMLVYAMNGAPLLPQHGYPLRLIVPGWLGMTNVKWLDNIELSTNEFKGHQMIAYSRAHDAHDEKRIPLTDMRVRAVMQPPGIPEFFTRFRYVEIGRQIILTGRAWVGHATIRSVEVSVNGGDSWQKAETGAHLGEFAWLSWRYPWTPDKLGRVQLRVRATDSLGRTQTDRDESEMNFYAMDVNKPQFVDVVVVEPGKLKEGEKVEVPVMFPSL